MKTDNTSHQTNVPPATLPPKPETFHVEYKICGYGGGETVFDIEGSYDIPLGMRREHLHRTILSNEAIFENAVKAPMKMAVIHALEGRFQRGTKQPVSTAEDFALAQPSDSTGAISPLSRPDLAAQVTDPFFPAEMPEMPFPPELTSPPLAPASRIVNPTVKNQPKSQRSPKGSLAPMPGDESERAAA